MADKDRRYKRCHMCGLVLREKKYVAHRDHHCRFRHLRNTVYETLPDGVRWRYHVPWLCHASGETRRDGPPPLIAPGRSVPVWLQDVAHSSKLPHPIPLCDLLADSCFYPASGFDPSPILLASGYVHSFVYVDYGIKREDFLQRIHWMPLIEGYELILERDVERDEIAPVDWCPSYFDTQEIFRTREERYRNEYALSRKQRIGFSVSSAVWANRIKTFEHDLYRSYEQFGHWSVWKRKKGEHPNRGPELLSFLFLSLEGGAACEALYQRNHHFPTVLAIIQPGHAFGGNFESFFDQRGSHLWEALEMCGEFPQYLIAGHSRGSMNLWSVRAHNTSNKFKFHGYIPKFSSETMYFDCNSVLSYFREHSSCLFPFGFSFEFNATRARAELGVEQNPDLEGSFGWWGDPALFSKLFFGWELLVLEKGSAQR